MFFSRDFKALLEEVLCGQFSKPGSLSKSAVLFCGIEKGTLVTWFTILGTSRDPNLRELPIQMEALYRRRVDT